MWPDLTWFDLTSTDKTHRPTWFAPTTRRSGTVTGSEPGRNGPSPESPGPGLDESLLILMTAHWKQLGELRQGASLLERRPNRFRE